MRLLVERVLTAGRRVVQPRARGGEVPRLFNAKAHVHLRLGALRRLFYWVPPCRFCTDAACLASPVCM